MNQEPHSSQPPRQEPPGAAPIPIAAAESPRVSPGAVVAPVQGSHPPNPPGKIRPTAKRTPHFSKIFRWQPEKPGGPLPVRVEIVGSFTGWQKMPLKYDRTNGIWQLALENIPGDRTHNYMLLVNGRPTQDKNSDGLAVPHSEPEKQYQLETPRGPRVFMLFSQTK